MNEFKKSLNKLIVVIKGNDSKKKINTIKSIVVLLLILCVCKTPLVLIRDLVVDYFNNMNIENILGNIFYWLFEILYILFVILMIRNWLIKEFGTNSDD